jgi:hypothetical protein
LKQALRFGIGPKNRSYSFKKRKQLKALEDEEMTELGGYTAALHEEWLREQWDGRIKRRRVETMDVDDSAAEDDEMDSSRGRPRTLGISRVLEAGSSPGP